MKTNGLFLLYFSIHVCTGFFFDSVGWEWKKKEKSECLEIMCDINNDVM